MKDSLSYPDVRVVRTRTALREAMLDLLQEQAYDAINVKEIAIQAGVNRVTFYNHYSSKDELLSEILEEKLEEYRSLIDEFSPILDREQLPGAHERFIRLNYEYIGRNAKVYKMLLSDRFPAYRNRFESHMGDIVRDVIRKSGKRLVDDGSLEFLVDFHIGGTVQVMRNWIGNGLRPSADEMTRHIRMMSAGFYAYFV